MHLLAVAAALGLQAHIGGIALSVRGIGSHHGSSREGSSSRGGLAQVLLAGAVLLKVHQAAACDPAHLQSYKSILSL